MRSLLLSVFVFPAGLLAASATLPYELVDWSEGESPERVGRRLVENMLPRWHVTAASGHNAPDAAWYSALEFAQLTDDAALREALIHRFDPFLAPGGSELMSRLRHVDHSVFGIVPLELFLVTKENKFLELGLTFARRQWEPIPADTENAAAMNALLELGLSPETRWWSDDLYMIVILQVQAFRATQDTVYLDRACATVAAYAEGLQQPNGLFYHGPDSPFFWGRANGWVAAGLAELLTELRFEHPGYEQVMSTYFRLMEGLLLNQGSNGMWHQLIDDYDSYQEASATAMFTFAFITGLENGWLTKTSYARAYAQGARNAWLSLVDLLDEGGNLSQICVGTGVGTERDYYLNRPTRAGESHGQAAMLWCAMALMR